MTGAPAVAEHPLRRVRLRRGMTQVELAGLAGLASSYISMIERGRRSLTRRDHVNALAAVLKVPPAEIAPSMTGGSDEWVPAAPPACAFPPAGDDLAMARHRDLAGRFIGHVISGDTCAAGVWLRRMARDPGVNPWLLLDQLTAAQHAVPGLSVRPSGGNWARVVSADSTGRGGWLNGIGEIIMCGTIGTARQASAGGHARHAAADRTAPVNGTARQPASAVRIPPLTDPQGNDMTGRWPLRSFLELGALPSAVPCARLHTRQLLWEWQLTVLSDTAELLVSELVTNAVQITQADAQNAPVRLWLWLLADRARLLMLVWDASPLPPVRVSPDDDTENGRGLLLVDTLSTRCDHFGHHSGGKVVWALLDAM